LNQFLSPRRLRRLRRLPLMSPRQWRRRVVLWGGAVVVALVAIVFAAAADQAGLWCQRLAQRLPWAMLLVAPAGLGLSVLLTRSVFPGAQGSGIPQVIASLHLHEAEAVDRLLSLRIASGKVALTLLGLLCGASIGREGPTVQVGAAIMHALGRWLDLPRLDLRRALVLAGGAAGVSAAFNTPLAGIVFAIEELSHSFEGRTSGTVLTSVILGGIATVALVGNYTYFGVTAASFDFGAGWLAVLVCGLTGGLAGGLFSRLLIVAARGLPGWLGGFAQRRPVGFAVGCGLAMAGLGLLSHGATYGTGYPQARALVAGTAHLPAVFFAEKFAANVVSYVSGVPGGIFAPSLAVGAGLGRWLANLMPFAPPAAVVLLGMGAYFSGVVQAPITGTVIVMEMTDNQAMTIPLLAASLLALAASRLVCRRPLYGTLARRFILPARRMPEAADIVPPVAAASDGEFAGDVGR
jgi:H+/Cl- antiporter ClcA